MHPAQFTDLLLQITDAYRDISPIVCGIQGIQCYTKEEIELVDSIPHADLLLAGKSRHMISELTSSFGKGSLYHTQNEVYVRPIGIKSISLPLGWQERLSDFSHQSRLCNVRVLDLHDLLAGLIRNATEEGFALIIELLKKKILDLQYLIQKNLDEKEAVASLQRLVPRLKQAGFFAEAEKLSGMGSSGNGIAEPDQLSLFFDRSASATVGKGLDSWREQQRNSLSKLAGSLGLPVGHRAQVILRSGVELQGRLILCEQKEAKRSKDILLRIDTIDFKASEVESCVRLEEL